MVVTVLVIGSGLSGVRNPYYTLLQPSHETQHRANFSDYNYCESGEINFSNCHVTSH